MLFLVKLIGNLFLNTNLLTKETKNQIEHWLTKYPPEQKRSAVVAALRITQEQNGGYLTDSLVEAVADYLELPRIAVFEAASFYDMLELKPIGKHKISVCTNVSCMLRGSDEITNHLKKRLGIGYGETTPDGLFTLQEAECLAACTNAPVCMLDNKEYIENLTTTTLDQIIDRCYNEQND